MLSQKARYALHALIVLAEHGDSRADHDCRCRCPGARAEEILEQILLDLKKRALSAVCEDDPALPLGKAPKNMHLCRSDPHDRTDARPRPLRQRDRLSQMTTIASTKKPAPSARCCWRRRCDCGDPGERTLAGALPSKRRAPRSGVRLTRHLLLN